MPNTDFRGRYDSVIRAITMAGDLLIVNAVFIAVCWIDGGHRGWGIVESHLLLTTLYFGLLSSTGIPIHISKVKNYQILENVFTVLLSLLVFGGLILYLCRFEMPRLLLWPAYVLLLVPCVAMFRFGMRRAVNHFWKRRKRQNLTIFVGATENNVALYHELIGDPSSGYRAVGYFSDEPTVNLPPKLPWLGTPDKVVDYLNGNNQIHHVFCCLPSHEKDTIVPIINWCENNMVRFYSVPNVRNYLNRQMNFMMVGSVPCLTLMNEPLTLIQNRIIKRLFDVVFSGLFLVTLFPVIFVIVAIVTKITMPGKIFFRQKRNGINGKEFYCLKFRSMVENAQADTLQATENDPRKTKWGNFLRRTSIDELPQFINVFLGQMSVVGPRPHMVHQNEEFRHTIDKYMARNLVKPGITGWSQVTGYRGETKTIEQMEERVRHDIWYIEHWSFTLDLLIIYKTIANAIKGDKQAY